MLNQDNVTRVIDGHRRWMAEAIQTCGHHESHFNSNTGKCVSCPDPAARVAPGKTLGELAAEAAFTVHQIADPYSETHGSGPYYNDVVMLLLELFQDAQRRGYLPRIVSAFDRLCRNEEHRVHRLLISLKRGRRDAVMAALWSYAV